MLEITYKESLNLLLFRDIQMGGIITINGKDTPFMRVFDGVVNLATGNISRNCDLCNDNNYKIVPAELIVHLH